MGKREDQVQLCGFVWWVIGSRLSDLAHGPIGPGERHGRSRSLPLWSTSYAIRHESPHL